MAVPMGSFTELALFEVSDVWLLRFAWQVWHFVTFRRVLQCVASRFAWQAQCFCDVFRDVLQFSWQAQHFGRVHRHFLWKFDALREHPLGKGEATCHSSSWHSFMHGRLVENILLVGRETCAL